MVGVKELLTAKSQYAYRSIKVNHSADKSAEWLFFSAYTAPLRFYSTC